MSPLEQEVREELRRRCRAASDDPVGSIAATFAAFLLDVDARVEVIDDRQGKHHRGAIRLVEALEERVQRIVEERSEWIDALQDEDSALRRSIHELREQRDALRKAIDVRFSILENRVSGLAGDVEDLGELVR